MAQKNVGKRAVLTHPDFPETYCVITEFHGNGWYSIELDHSLWNHGRTHWDCHKDYLIIEAYSLKEAL